MNIFITGGTGLIGSLLVETLLARGERITLHTRNAARAEEKFGMDMAYAETLDTLGSLDGYDAVINLAGESIAPRWSAQKKKDIRESRLTVTRKLADLILAGSNPPAVFLSGSAVGYYGGAQDNAVLDENARPCEDFLHSVCVAWEAEAMRAASATRVCLSRTGIVLSSKGGMLSSLMPLFRLGLGAIMGSGRQYISWVHHEDMVGMLLFLLDNDKAAGPFNMTAPSPVDNREFSHALARALRRPCFLKAPAFAVRMMLGEASTLVLDGQRAVPRKMAGLGYVFRFPDIEAAVTALVKDGA